jgi:heme A synthase
MPTPHIRWAAEAQKRHRHQRRFIRNWSIVLVLLFGGIITMAMRDNAWAALALIVAFIIALNTLVSQVRWPGES